MTLIDLIDIDRRVYRSMILCNYAMQIVITSVAVIIRVE